ncbi:MAG: FAD-binding protein [Elusimicrobia bacterium]|nr:FAD-binding protein [Elusimicrobiota bacterium]
MLEKWGVPDFMWRDHKVKIIAELERVADKGRLLTDEVDILSYTYDAALDRARPEAIFIARDAAQVQRAVQICLKHKVPYVARGAGTNLSGGCIPLKGGVVISLVGMDKILEIDTQSHFAVVEPGVVNFRLQKELEGVGFFYAPDPASYKACTLGGNVAENAGGPRCLKYGVTSNHVLALECVMPNGDIQKWSLQDSGPEIMSLLVGAEGTLGIVTKIWLKILPMPEMIETSLAAFPSLESAIEAVSEIIASGVVPRTLEAMDRVTVEAVESYVHAGYPLQAEAVLLIELDGTSSRVSKESKIVQEICKKHKAFEYRVAREFQEREKLWEGRRGAYASLARLAPNVLVEDGVVPRNKLSEALKDIKEIAAKHEVKMALLFHAGDGNLHPNIIFDERNLFETKQVKRAGYEILKHCVSLGGSISGEHGIGVDKRVAMSWLFTPPTLNLFRRLKKFLDPDNLSNPDKIIPLASDQEPILFRPSSKGWSFQAQKIIEMARERCAHKISSVIIGSGTKLSHPFRREDILYTNGLDQVLELDDSNYTLTVEAGITLHVLKETLKKKGFYLPIPDGKGSLGGLISAKAWGGVRDYLLGMRLLLANGDVVELGGNVVKNVAGYDVPKLLIGSWGGLAIILDVTLKVFAQPFPLSSHISYLSSNFFVPNNWHRRIKQAFDPDNLFNPWIFAER